MVFFLFVCPLFVFKSQNCCLGDIPESYHLPLLTTITQSSTYKNLHMLITMLLWRETELLHRGYPKSPNSPQKTREFTKYCHHLCLKHAPEEQVLSYILSLMLNTCLSHFVLFLFCFCFVFFCLMIRWTLL